MPLSDGIQDPKGLFMIAFGPLFLAAVPVTSWLAGSNGIAQKLTQGLLSALPGSITQERVIPALGAYYIFVTFALTGAVSAAAQATSMRGGRLDNNHPRKHISVLTGLPLRMRSAHYNLMEMFPGWAFAAALAYSTAPNSTTLINLLGLHVVVKTLVYYPAYLLDVAPLRSLAHLVATGSVINVAWRLATGNY